MSRHDVIPIVMGLHPTSRGFGWTLFHAPTYPLDWGIAFIRGGDANRSALQHLRFLLERHRPEILILEHAKARTGKRASRTQQLLLDAASLADELGITVERYTQSDLQQALGLAKSATRHDTAKLVAAHIEALRHRLPPERKPWEGWDRRLALFSAAALALTYYCVSDW
jgi:hypothetical protein